MDAPHLEQLKAAVVWLKKKDERMYARIVEDAHDEIERLRASQPFRWIPVGDKKQPACDSKYLLLDRQGKMRIWEGEGILRDDTHWAPIPPLPEKSQGEKDEELWVAYDDMHAMDTGHKEYRIRQAFLAGLRASRERKP